MNLIYKMKNRFIYNMKGGGGNSSLIIIILLLVIIAGVYYYIISNNKSSGPVTSRPVTSRPVTSRPASDKTVTSSGIFTIERDGNYFTITWDPQQYKYFDYFFDNKSYSECGRGYFPCIDILGYNHIKLYNINPRKVDDPYYDPKKDPPRPTNPPLTFSVITFDETGNRINYGSVNIPGAGISW